LAPIDALTIELPRVGEVALNCELLKTAPNQFVLRFDVSTACSNHPKHLMATVSSTQIELLLGSVFTAPDGRFPKMRANCTSLVTKGTPLFLHISDVVQKEGDRLSLPGERPAKSGFDPAQIATFEWDSKLLPLGC
jgi:hypothetical protein